MEASHFPVVLEDAHHAVAVVVRAELVERRGVVEGQIAVAVGDEKRLFEERKRAAEGAARSEERFAFVGVFDADAEARAIADVLANLIAQMRDAHHGALIVVLYKQFELPLDERTPRDLEQNLRHGERLGTHPGREPAGENDCLS